MKICAIGNSHLAAIKKGWDQIGNEFPHLELIFFGAHATDLRYLQIQGDALVPSHPHLREMMHRTSGGRDRIEGTFDLYLIVGCQLSFNRLVLGVMEKQGGADGTGVLQKALAVSLARSIRQISGAPILVLPGPYASGDDAEEAYEWNGSDSEMLTLKARYVTKLETLGRDAGFTPLLQPERTIREEYFTKHKFAVGGVRLSGAGDESTFDGYHMNQKFGAIYLRHVFKKFASATDQNSAS